MLYINSGINPTIYITIMAINIKIIINGENAMNIPLLKLVILSLTKLNTHFDTYIN